MGYCRYGSIYAPFIWDIVGLSQSFPIFHIPSERKNLHIFHVFFSHVLQTTGAFGPGAFGKLTVTSINGQQGFVMRFYGDMGIYQPFIYDIELI
jgi:hypothetical protein